MISIIITAYNEERYIERAIQSAMQQSYSDVEIIVVNDGSTDNTGKIADAYRSRATVIRNERPLGLMAARNLGVEHSRGSLITFLDGDDEFHVHKLRVQSDVLLSLPRRSMLFTGRVVYSEKGIARIPNRRDITGGLKKFDYNEVLQKKAGSLGATLMMARDDYLTSGGMDSHVGKERDFIARFSVLGGNLYKLFAPLYFQHRKPNSMSTQKVKVFEREQRMLEAWRPRPSRDVSRAISVAEFEAYESSVAGSVARQFARRRESPPSKDFKSHWSTMIARFVILRTKDSVASIVGRWTYLRYRWCGRDSLWMQNLDRRQC